MQSLACHAKHPHSHPNQHTAEELKLIQDMRRRNPNLGMVELWHWLRKRGYTRRSESLFRVIRKMGFFPPRNKKSTCRPKPYEQMSYPGQRVQVDLKIVPHSCIADPELRLFQYTAVDEFTRLRFLVAHPEQSTYSSADFLQKLSSWYARRGIRVECVQTDSCFEFTHLFPTASAICQLYLNPPLPNWAFGTNSSSPIHPATTARRSAVIGRTRNVSIPVTAFLTQRLCQTVHCPQPPFQQLPHETS